jgi:hypothetical protein
MRCWMMARVPSRSQPSIRTLEIPDEAAVAVEPGEAALDHPAAGQDSDASEIGRSPDDLEAEPFARRRRGGADALVGAVGKQMGQPREAPPGAGADQGQAVAVLDVGGPDRERQQQPPRVGDQVALATVDVLAGIPGVQPFGWPEDRLPLRPPLRQSACYWRRRQPCSDRAVNRRSRSAAPRPGSG